MAIWTRNYQLPKTVRSVLPHNAQTRFRVLGNVHHAMGADIPTSVVKAWDGVAEYWEPNGDGKWIEKWDEAKHPRGHGGLFAPKGGGGATASSTASAAVAGAAHAAAGDHPGLSSKIKHGLTTAVAAGAATRAVHRHLEGLAEKADSAADWFIQGKSEADKTVWDNASETVLRTAATVLHNDVTHALVGLGIELATSSLLGKAVPILLPVLRSQSQHVATAATSFVIGRMASASGKSTSKVTYPLSRALRGGGKKVAKAAPSVLSRLVALERERMLAALKGSASIAPSVAEKILVKENPKLAAKLKDLVGAVTGEDLTKRDPTPLYVRRNVLNAKDIIKWAKAQGFETTVPPDQMHVTVIFSRQPVDWMSLGQTYSGEDKDGKITIPPGGPRAMDLFGPQKDAAVLLFTNSYLASRNQRATEMGASWDFEDYQPHITITWNKGDVDISKITPYNGEIILGPEIFEPLKDDWKDNLVEKCWQHVSIEKVGARHNSGDMAMLQHIHDHAVKLGAKCPAGEGRGASAMPPNSTIEVGKSAEEFDVDLIKVDSSLGLVFGWAIICKKNDQEYYDLNKDKDSGDVVPEHIPEQSMLDSATEFMQNYRIAKEMHIGDEKGTIVFAFPLTTEIAKAMGIKTSTTGLMIAMKPQPSLLKKFANGTYKGFSIGGRRLKVTEETN